MANFNWRPFLEQYSRELLADRAIRADVPESVVQSAWMGFDPATADDISELEGRLGTELPDSYKQFLATSNGWRQSGGFIYDLFPCAKVEWFCVNNQDWIDAYVEPAADLPRLSLAEHCVYGEEQDCCQFRVEYLQSSLLISDIGDSAVYLLNPEVKTQSGEWEAWFFANWNPGADRYRSFWDLMQAEYRSLVDLRNHEEVRYFPEDGIETLGPKLLGLVKELSDKAQSHRKGQQQRAARGQFSTESYTDGIIQALNDAEFAVKKIEAQGLPANATLDALIHLAADFEHQWKTNVRPGTCGVDIRDGRAEGCREATGIIRWFLNQPQN